MPYHNMLDYFNVLYMGHLETAVDAEHVGSFVGRYEPQWQITIIGPSLTIKRFVVAIQNVITYNLCSPN